MKKVKEFLNEQIDERHGHKISEDDEENLTNKKIQNNYNQIEKWQIKRKTN